MPDVLKNPKYHTREKLDHVAQMDIMELIKLDILRLMPDVGYMVMAEIVKRLQCQGLMDEIVFRIKNAGDDGIDKYTQELIDHRDNMDLPCHKPPELG